MTGAERVGRTVALRLGRLIENKRIERGMGRLHSGGRLFIGRHNNQIKVGFDVGGETLERRRDQGRTCVGMLSP